MSDQQIWHEMKTGFDSNYTQTIDTLSLHGGGHENDCGITYQHAYAILAAFELKDEDGNVAHRMVMIRNPRKLHFYDGKWNTKDRYSWT
jgi:hypothetical protein